MDLSTLSGDAERVQVPRAQTGELLVSEIFGPTIQGEGPSAGRAACFVRLGNCNLSCVWCDTAYTWDSAAYDLTRELAVMRTEDVESQVRAISARLVVFTGGEPALQADEAARLAHRLRASGRRVELETNGTVALGPLMTALDAIIVSPKLSNSGVIESARLRFRVLAELAASALTSFKFVVAGEHELAEVDAIASSLSLPPDRVWIMPEGREPDDILRRMRQLAEPVSQRGWALSSRLHILLWGDERGR